MGALPRQCTVHGELLDELGQPRNLHRRRSTPRTTRYAEIAIIFDNLHAMHDVISDVLADSAVPWSRKRTEILRAVARYRDDTSSVTTVAEWCDMAEEMGVEHMGGRAVPVEPPPPDAPGRPPGVRRP